MDAMSEVRKDIELKAKMREARLVSEMASLEERVKETEAGISRRAAAFPIREEIL